MSLHQTTNHPFHQRLLPLVAGLLALALAACQTPSAGIARINPATRNHSVGPHTVLIASNGVAALPVIVASTNAAIRAVAEELTNYLARITGAAFELVTGGTGPGIYVGTIAEFPTPSAAAGLRIFDAFDGQEAFAIRTEKDRIKLLGATYRGVPHAASRFLEGAGCRWFFQGPAWEVLPRVPRLSCNLNVTDRPELLIRYLGHPLGESFEKNDPDAGAALRAWWRHNRVGKSFQTAVGHCYSQIVRRFQKEFEEHPEYRALPKKGGPRTGEGKTGKDFSPWGQLCISNPRVVELAIQYANEYFDKRPGADMIGVGPDDGGGWCVCDECAKFGNPGNQAFHLANQVAKALQKSHPGKFVGIYAYNWHCDPPDFPLEPNVYIELTTALLLNTKYGFDELLDRWPKQCRYVGLYDYWAVYDWIRDRLPSGRTGNTGYVAGKLPYYIRKGVCGLSAESGNSWGSQGLGYYLGARVLWDSRTDTAALKREFYEQAFGPAAAAMRTYYERIDLANKPLVGPTFYRLCLDDLAKAEAAAQGHPDVLTRLEHLKQYHVFVYLLGKTHQQGVDAAARKKYALDMLKWNYRIRNTYMTFWSFFADQTTRQLAKEFEEPSWWWWKMHSEGKADAIPYRNQDPIRPEETARWIEEMKEAFGEVRPVTEVRFSNDLVAPEWEPAQPAAPAPFFSQGPWCVALASTNGGPLHLTVEHGTIYQNFPNGKFSLTDCRGNIVLNGRLPYGPTNLVLKVPAPDVYLFRYDDFSAGSHLRPSTDTRTAFVLERGGHFTVYNHSYLYFYVPTGTKEIHLYAKRGNLFGVRQPDGTWVGQDRGERNPYRIARCLEGDGSYQTIPVPAGMDGKVWSSVDMVSGSFYFFNIPNLLFTRPDNVIVPREVADRDGLDVARESGR